MGIYNSEHYIIGLRININVYESFVEKNKLFIPNNLSIKKINEYAYIVINSCQQEIDKIRENLNLLIEKRISINKLKNICYNLNNILKTIDISEQNSIKYNNDKIQELKKATNYDNYEENKKIDTDEKNNAYNNIKINPKDASDAIELYIKITGSRSDEKISLFYDKTYSSTYG